MNDRNRFDLFTVQAKRVLDAAQEEARRFGHHDIGTEHLLLALLRERESVAAGVLESLGVNLKQVRVEVLKLLPQSDNK